MQVESGFMKESLPPLAAPTTPFVTEPLCWQRIAVQAEQISFAETMPTLDALS
jgi:hypothetical protein